MKRTKIVVQKFGHSWFDYEECEDTEPGINEARDSASWLRERYPEAGGDRIRIIRRTVETTEEEIG